MLVASPEPQLVRSCFRAGLDGRRSTPDTPDASARGVVTPKFAARPGKVDRQLKFASEVRKGCEIGSTPVGQVLRTPCADP